MATTDMKEEIFNRHIACIAYDRLCVFEYGIVAEVFGMPRPEMGPDWYRFAVIAGERGPLRAGGGLTITGDGGLELLDTAGTIIIPGWRSMEEPPPAPLLHTIAAAHARGVRLVSLCSGVFVLAAAGVIDGRRVTTHWLYVEALRQRFPRLTVEDDVLYVEDGQILTAAGSAAGIDLCLHIVRSDFGSDAANIVARRLVVQPLREGCQRQQVERAVPSPRDGRRLGPLLDSLRLRLGENIRIENLADEVAMSPRTFSRRFKLATGYSPGEWLLEERLLYARTLIETTQASLEEIAALCGLGTATNLRVRFKRRFGSPPSEFRGRHLEVESRAPD